MNIFFWRKSKAPPLVIPGLRIIFRYPPDSKVHTFTYESDAGKPLMYYATTRRFIKWYFGRPQSASVFISGKNNRLEWRRDQILRIELIQDLNSE